MADWTVNLIPYARDNYAYLIESDQALAVIDPGEAAPVEQAIQALGKPLTQILITHKHDDHVGGVKALADQHNPEIYGPALSRETVESAHGFRYTHTLSGGESIDCLGAELEVIATPGHTLDHLSFHAPGHAGLFCADTLFVLGCGRLFEGDAETMWQSLCKLRDLPDDTLVFCGHEYTMTNLQFTKSLSPKDARLEKHARQLKGLRDKGQPTIPSTIGDETLHNPFLRCDDLDFVAQIGMKGADAVQVFAHLREKRNAY